MKQTTRASYRQRLLKVLDYIHDSIHNKGHASHSDALDVNTLADVATLSPYHFHRIYREMMMETVNATVRRLRLQQAAIDLIRSEQSIESIAKGASYTTPEAFSRAFSKAFAMGPAEYRKSKSQQPVCNEPFIAMLPTTDKRYDDMFKAEIVSIPTIRLAGYHHHGDYMAIGTSFEKLMMTAGSHCLLNENTRSFGLYYDDPKSIATDELRSMACISVDTNPNDEIHRDTDLETACIPAGQCVSVLFKGPYAELETAYDWLFGEHIPENNIEMADFPPFEEYLNDPKTTPPSELLTRIYCLVA